MRGYTTAAAVHVLVSQLKYVFAISLEEKSGPLSLIYVSTGRTPRRCVFISILVSSNYNFLCLVIFPQTFVEICSKLPGTHTGTLVTALISMIALLLIKLLNDKLDKKLPVPIPIELLTVTYWVMLQEYWRACFFFPKMTMEQQYNQ